MYEECHAAFIKTDTLCRKSPRLDCFPNIDLFWPETLEFSQKRNISCARGHNSSHNIIIMVSNYKTSWPSSIYQEEITGSILCLTPLRLHGFTPLSPICLYIQLLEYEVLLLVKVLRSCVFATLAFLNSSEQYDISINFNSLKIISEPIYYIFSVTIDYNYLLLINNKFSFICILSLFIL